MWAKSASDAGQTGEDNGAFTVKDATNTVKFVAVGIQLPRPAYI